MPHPYDTQDDADEAADRDEARYERECDKADIAWKERDDDFWFKAACEIAGEDIEASIAQRQLDWLP